MTGKAVIPVIRSNSAHYVSYLSDQRHEFEGDAALRQFRKVVRDHGYYPVVMSQEEFAATSQDPEQVHELFTREMRRVAEEWIAMAVQAPAQERPVRRLPGQRRSRRYRRDRLCFRAHPVGRGYCS